MELESNATKCTECNLTGKSYFFDGTVPPPEFLELKEGWKLFFYNYPWGFSRASQPSY